MKPGIWNIDIYESEDFSMLFVFKIKATGVPIDLTGWSAQASRTVNGVKSDFTCTIPDPTAGAVLVVEDRSVTTSMVDAKGKWDLFLINPSGKAIPYLIGTCKTHATCTEVTP